MNPLEDLFRMVAEKAENENRFAHLTHEQHVERMMECNRVFWENITFNTLPDGDERGRDMQQLILNLRTMDLAQYHKDHFFINEDEALRKESNRRCKFWYKHHDMIVAACAYAEYCGYITNNHDACDKATDAIEAKYEAMKPTDNEQSE